jgi:extracellular factor (EF) 3-hydroxypalmitic acid methyl ester biosynthesis protein
VVLCSPFLYRTLQKPLGYAGDYEMVNMMTRDPFEGANMFAKMVNRIFLNTPPVLAHQARIGYLVNHLVNETSRAAGSGRRCQIYNLGCGPAREIQEFIIHQDISDHAEFSLLDFNDETLNYTGKTLGDLKRQHGRATSVQVVKRSVQQILKDSGKPPGATKYDMVYCAGLFDYLSDPVCRKLMNYFYGMVAPGGFLLATNVSASNPSRNWMEYVLDWYLIYRDSAQMAALKPTAASADDAKVVAIGDGVNIGLEVRKPL